MKKTLISTVTIMLLIGGFIMFGQYNTPQAVENNLEATSVITIEYIDFIFDDNTFSQIDFGEDNDPEIVEVAFGEDNDPEIVEVAFGEDNDPEIVEVFLFSSVSIF